MRKCVNYSDFKINITEDSIPYGVIVLIGIIAWVFWPRDRQSSKLPSTPKPPKESMMDIQYDSAMSERELEDMETEQMCKEHDDYGQDRCGPYM